ncbi:glycosyltransferase [Candidatus Microgenomates bacterium]|nr:glycosyltransferase [Candidatus Microgenomates bacterium]
MKVAIDISPLTTGHKVRGVGFYLQHLKDALITYFPQDAYIFFTRLEEIPQDVDLVHYPYFDPFFVTLPLWEKHKRVVTVHDLTPIVFPDHFPAGIKGNLSWQIQKFNLRKSDVIITDSDSSTKDVAKFTGIATSKITTVHLAAGEEFHKMDLPAGKAGNGELRI